MISFFFFILFTYLLFNISSIFIHFSIRATSVVSINCLLLFSLITVLTYLFWDIVILFGEASTFFQSQNVHTTSLDLSLSIELNFLSYSFAFLVTLIGFSANLYSLNYFKNEADEKKLVTLLNLFILSMLLLVLSGNFFSLFLGWELIGLTSFFLINFWSLKISVLKCALKAFTYNLVSDILFLGALVCFYIDSGVTNFTQFTSWVITSLQAESNLSIINSYTGYGTIMLCICASIKSVQIIGHLWLPDSMEAPVPASALIHSATLVSAGIFLICNFNLLLSIYNIQSILAFTGAITAAYGGVAASQQTDMKKLLAYSTMSHCGFMWFLSSYGLLQLTIIYLFLHGIFKAATFFCAGSFIRSNNSQDTRWMTIGSISLPLDSVLLLICSSNLSGLPLTLGYLYKQLFISMMFSTNSASLSIALLSIGLLSSIVYFYKITKYTLFSYNKAIFNNQLLITSSTSYKINNNFTLYNINHTLAVFVVLAVGSTWSYLFWQISLSILNLENYTLVEILLNQQVNNDLVNQNSTLTFYSLYSVVSITTFMTFWKRETYAVESLLATLLFLLFFILLECEDI